MDPEAFIALAFVLICAVIAAVYISTTRKQRTVSVRPNPDLTDMSSVSISISAEKRHFFLGVHGIFHQNSDGSNRQSIIRQCLPGEELDLFPEPDNAYDADAIKVCRKNGDQLGYLPAGSRMNDDLDKYRVTIAYVTELEDKPGKYECTMRVGVLAPNIQRH
jgi:hypothetical protein